MDINEIARMAGVSRATVSRYLNNGYVSKEKRELIAKVIVRGRTRLEAIEKMRTALEEMVIVGVHTNLDFQYSIMENETFRAGRADTGFIDKFLKGEV